MRNLTSPDWYGLQIMWKGTDGTSRKLTTIRRGGSVRGMGHCPDDRRPHRFPSPFLVPGDLVMKVTDHAGNTTIQHFAVKNNDLVRPATAPPIHCGRTGTPTRDGLASDHQVRISVSGDQPGPGDFAVRVASRAALDQRHVGERTDLVGIHPLRITEVGGSHRIVVEASDLFGNTVTRSVVVEAARGSAPAKPGDRSAHLRQRVPTCHPAWAGLVLACLFWIDSGR